MPSSRPMHVLLVENRGAATAVPREAPAEARRVVGVAARPPGQRAGVAVGAVLVR